MELISTAQFKRAMDRATAATAYTRRITALVGHLAHAGLEVTHPLLLPRPEPKKAVLLVLTANRGLCGGYNSSVLRLANTRYRELRDTVPELRLEVAGKRGISAFKFRKMALDETYTHFNDRPTFAEVDVLAVRYLADFLAGAIDRLDVVYTKYESVSRQQAVVETLLKRSTSSSPRPRAFWTRWCRQVSRCGCSSVSSTRPSASRSPGW
jgi:F-type H+-transporting ATPase subunit gamma